MTPHKKGCTGLGRDPKMLPRLGTAGGGLLQAEATVMIVVWVVVLVFVAICLMAAMMFLFFVCLQVLLRSCDVPFCDCYCCSQQQDDEDMNSWCYIQCEASICEDNSDIVFSGMELCRYKTQIIWDNLHLAKVELISSLKCRQNTKTQAIACVFLIVFLLLVLQRMKSHFTVLGAANNGKINVSACGRHCCDRTPVYEIETTTQILIPWTSWEWPRESCVPVSKLKHSKEWSTQNCNPHIASTILKFFFNSFITGVPQYAQFVRSTSAFIRNKFLVLCYEFFSVAYGNVIPMIRYSAQQLVKRYNRDAEETVQIQLHGGPNHGYCAMLSIGALDQIQQVPNDSFVSTNLIGAGNV